MIWLTCEFGQPGFLNKTCKHSESTLIQLGMIWAMEYLVTFHKKIQLQVMSSPSTKSMFLTNIYDGVMFDSNTLLIYIKIRLIYYLNQELTSIIVESKGHDSILSVTILRRLDVQRYSDRISSIKYVKNICTELSNDSTAYSASAPGNLPLNNPKRHAAVKAQHACLSQVLMTKH